MTATDIKRAKKIIDKHKEYTDHYADQEYTKEGILKMVEEYALYTEPVSEEAMMTKAKEFLNGDTPDIQKGVNTMHWAAYRMAKFALYMQQRQVKQIEVQPREVKESEIENALRNYAEDGIPSFCYDEAAQAIHNLIYGDSPNKQ